jgi:hypothetical protein
MTSPKLQIEFRSEKVGPNVTECHVISSGLKGVLHFDTEANHYTCDLQGPNGKVKGTFDTIPDLKKAFEDFIREQLSGMK